MSQLPKLFKGDRIRDAVALPLLSVGQAICLAIGVFATREAFEALHSSGGLSGWTLTKLIGSGLMVAALEILRRISAERIGQSYANALRIVLYRHLAGMRQTELESRRLGALSLRFVGDLTAARNWFGQGLPRVIAGIVILPGAAAILWKLDPKLATVSCIILGAAMILMVLAALGFERLHSNLRSRRASISISMMERIAIAPQLDLMGRTPHELHALHDQGLDLQANAMSRAWRTGVLIAIPQIGLALAGAAVMWQAAAAGIAPGTVAAALSLLALLMLPLRDLAHSWDYFNAWRIARTKALVLLAKPSQTRQPIGQDQPVSVTARGRINGLSVALNVPAGGFGYLRGGSLKDRSALALNLAGLDTEPDIRISYCTGTGGLPRISFIGEKSIALQGSLRRVLSLGIEPRPKTATVLRMGKRFGLDALLAKGKNPLGLRIAESGRNVSSVETLRIDLTRTALSKPNLVIIDTARLAADPGRSRLLRQLARRTNSTIVIVDRAKASDQPLRFEQTQESKRARESRS